MGIWIRHRNLWPEGDVSRPFVAEGNATAETRFQNISRKLIVFPVVGNRSRLLDMHNSGFCGRHASALSQPARPLHMRAATRQCHVQARGDEGMEFKTFLWVLGLELSCVVF